MWSDWGDWAVEARGTHQLFAATNPLQMCAREETEASTHTGAAPFPPCLRDLILGCVSFLLLL